MIISMYNISLVSLGRSHLELVRNARNSEFIQSRMLYRQAITSWQQALWYKSLSQEKDFYFLICTDENIHGLINVKNIDFNNGDSESGLFIWNKKALESPLPVLASWTLSHAGYGVLGGNHTIIRVLKNNETAVNFNLALGFSIVSSADDFYVMKQTSQSFLQATAHDRKRYVEASGIDEAMHVSFGDHEHDDFWEQCMPLFSASGSMKSNHLGNRKYRLFPSL